MYLLRLVIPNFTTVADFAFWNWQIRSLGQNINTLNNLVTLSDDKKSIVLNTPKSLDLVSSLKNIAAFDSSFSTLAKSKAYQNKMIWLIHQINYRTITDTKTQSYLLVNERHYEMLGVSPNLMKLMLRALMVINVIKQTSKASAENKTCARYATVNPFNHSTAKKHFFNLIDGKREKFILKWVANDYKVVENRLCKYVKQSKPIHNTTEVEDLKKLVGILQAENDLLREKLNISKALTIDDQISIEEITPLNKEISADKKVVEPAKIIAPVASNETKSVVVTDDEGITTTIINFNLNKVSDLVKKQISSLYKQNYKTVQILDFRTQMKYNFAKEMITADNYRLTYLEAM